MHAGVRRVPAERARHAKRLGYVQSGSGPTLQVLAASAASTGTTTTPTQQSATTTSSQTTSTNTSANQSSSGAPSSSPTQSSSVPPSSATTSPTSSVAVTATTQSPAPTAPSSSLSLTTPQIPSSSTSPTSSSTSTPQTNVAAATNSGLSGGAIAGIIAGAVIVGTALIVFFIRKTVLRRRERKHISWGVPPGLHEPKPSPDVSEQPDTSFISAANTPQRSALLSPFEAHGQPMYSTPVPPVAHMHPPTTPTYAVPTPPPATYNNPTPVVAYPTQPVPSRYSPGSNTALAMARVPAGTGISSHLPAVRAQRAPMEAIVKCAFVPTLPDELFITTGERIFIVEQYDDGWDLCMNGRGERGMVPRECLERAPSDQPDIGWTNVKRISSLNPDGRRF